MKDAPMNRILIDASTLQAIIDTHPEVEVELMRTAVPQIAENLLRKIQEKEGSWSQQIDKALRRLEGELSSKWKIPDAAKGVIRSFLADEVREEIKAFAKSEAAKSAIETVKPVIAEELRKAREEIKAAQAVSQGEIAQFVRERAEAEFIALVRAAATGKE